MINMRTHGELLSLSLRLFNAQLEALISMIREVDGSSDGAVPIEIIESCIRLSKMSMDLSSAVTRLGVIIDSRKSGASDV